MSRWPSSSAVCLCRTKATGMMFASSLASNLLTPALHLRVPQQGGPRVLSHVPPDVSPAVGREVLSFFKDIFLILVPRRLLEKGTSPFLSPELPFAQFRFQCWGGGCPRFPPSPFPLPLFCRVQLTFGSCSERDSQANIDLCCPHGADQGELVQNSPAALGGMEQLRLIRMKPSSSSHYSLSKCRAMEGYSEPKSLFAQPPLCLRCCFSGATRALLSASFHNPHFCTSGGG